MKNIIYLIWVWNTNAPRDLPGDEAFAYEELGPAQSMLMFWPRMYIETIGNNPIMTIY